MSALTTSQSSTQVNERANENDGLCYPSRELLAETRLHGDALAPLGPAARQHLGSAPGLHASPEAVLFRALAPVGLKCTFGHEKLLLLIESTGLRQTESINEGERGRQTGVVELLGIAL